MASAFEIARRHLEAAKAEAEGSGVASEALRSALLSVILELELAHQAPEDLLRQIGYIIENADPDTDFPFMRP